MSKKTPSTKSNKKVVKNVIKNVTVKSAKEIAAERRSYRMKAHFPKARKKAGNLETPVEK